MTNRKILKDALILTIMLMIYNFTFFSDHSIFLMTTTKKIVVMLPTLAGFTFLFYLVSKLKTTEGRD